MSEHTPTPWILRDGPDPDIYTADGTWIVNQVCSGAMSNGDDGRANGEFIVRAVNSHDELVAALADWLYFAESLDCDFSDMEAPECDPNESLCCEQCKEVGCIQRKVRNARAALAKARG